MMSPACAGNCVGNPIGELFYSGPARNYPDRKPQPASEPGGMDYHIGHITFVQHHTLTPIHQVPVHTWHDRVPYNTSSI